MVCFKEERIAMNGTGRSRLELSRQLEPEIPALTSAQNLNHVPKRSNNLANCGRNLPG